MTNHPDLSLWQIPVGPGARWQYRVLRLLAVPILRMAFRLRVVGRANIPANRPYVLVANHVSWIDAPAILLAFPIEPRISFLADAAFVGVKRVEGFVARRIGGLILCNRHEQGHPDVIRQARACLADHGPVGVFPEGHYGDRDGKLLPFEPGFAHFALDSGAPVLPVAVSGSQSLWLGKRVTTIIGTPIEPQGYTIESLVAEAHRQVQALLPVYREPRGPKLFRSVLSQAFA